MIYWKREEFGGLRILSEKDNQAFGAFEYFVDCKANAAFLSFLVKEYKKTKR